MNAVALVNRFQTSSVKCWIANFCIHTSKGPAIIVNYLKSIYSSPFKDSHSHPIHTYFVIIASNVVKIHFNLDVFSFLVIISKQV